MSDQNNNQNNNSDTSILNNSDDSTNTPPLTIPTDNLEEELSETETTKDTSPDTPQEDYFPPVSNTPPKKNFGTNKVIATFLGMVLLVGGIVAGLLIIRNPQLFKQKAATTTYSCGDPDGTTACVDSTTISVCVSQQLHFSTCTYGCTTSSGKAVCASIQGTGGGANGDACLTSTFACPGTMYEGVCTDKAGDNCPTQQQLDCANSGGVWSSSTNSCISSCPSGTQKVCSYNVYNGTTSSTDCQCVPQNNCQTNRGNCYVTSPIGIMETPDPVTGLRNVCDAGGHWTTCAQGYYCDTGAQDCLPMTTTTTGGNPTPTPTATPRPVCNSICSSNSDCLSGMVCDNSTSGSTTGNCRNPSCLNSSSCVCSSTSPTPTPTPTPSPTPLAACSSVTAYSTTWTAYTSTDLGNLKAGNQVNFCVNGTADSGSFDMARFTINGVLQATTTMQRPNSTDFCQTYTIPTSVYAFDVTAEIHHIVLGWVGP